MHHVPCVQWHCQEMRWGGHNMNFSSPAQNLFKVWDCLNLFTWVLGAIHLWRPQKIRFLTPPFLCPHAFTWAGPLPLLWTSTCGRHEIHIALLKRLVQWPSRPKAQIQLYDCNLFKTVLLVIYITNLYRLCLKNDINLQKAVLLEMGAK